MMQGRKEGLPNPKVKKELLPTKAPASTSGKRAQSTPIQRIAIDSLKGLPESDPTQPGATLKDLCEEDKQKVARLIRQVISLTKEKEKLQRGAEEDRESHQKVLEALQAQNRDLIEEVTGLRLRLVQAQGLLCSYQHKLRALKEGPSREAALWPTSPLHEKPLSSPTDAPPDTLPESFVTSVAAHNPLGSPFIAAPLLQGFISPRRKASAQASSRAIDEPEQKTGSPKHGSSLLTGRSADSANVHKSKALEVSSEAKTAECLSTAQLGSGAPPSGRGVWAAWAELEQRIRCINGELAQTKAAAARDQQGTAAGPTAEGNPSSDFEAASSETQKTKEEVAVAQSPTAEVLKGEASPDGRGRCRGGLDAAEATKGAAQADPSFSEKPPAQMSASQAKDIAPDPPARPLVGGLVSEPQLTCSPPREQPVCLLQPSTASVDVQSAAPPPEAVLTPSSPTARPLSSLVSPSRARPEEGVPSPVAGGGPHVKGPPPPKYLPRKPLELLSRDLRPVAAVGSPEVVASSREELLQGDGVANGVRKSTGAAAVVAAEVEASLVQRSRHTDVRGGNKEPVAELPVKGHDESRLQVLRFDPTVGEAGAFYYVDVLSEVEVQGEARDRLTATEGPRTAGEDARRSWFPWQRVGQEADDCGAADEHGCELDANRSEREAVALNAGQPVRIARKEVKSNGVRNKSPERGRLSEGRPRWVSGMLYDSSLLELVEELEMGNGQEGQEGAFQDAIPAVSTREERGEGFVSRRTAPRQAVARLERLEKRYASTRLAAHKRHTHPRLEPEVLVLSNGW